MTRFEGRSFLVTGAGSGIGRALASKLAEDGARVILVGRDLKRLDETCALLPAGRGSAHVCDVGDESAISGLFGQLRGDLTALHGLVHCAGIHWLRPLQITDSALLSQMLTSHVVSSIAVTRGLMASRLAAKDGCSVVWMSSVAALRGGAGSVAYSAAKGAIISAARALAVELARRKVRVNVIAPGVVHTPQSHAWMSQMTPEQVQAITAEHLLGLGTPEDIANVAAFLLSDEARWITGTTIVADGGLTAH